MIAFWSWSSLVEGADGCISPSGKLLCLWQAQNKFYYACMETFHTCLTVGPIWLLISFELKSSMIWWIKRVRQNAFDKTRSTKRLRESTFGGGGSLTARRSPTETVLRWKLLRMTWQIFFLTFNWENLFNWNQTTSTNRDGNFFKR